MIQNIQPAVAKSKVIKSKLFLFPMLGKAIARNMLRRQRKYRNQQ